MSRDIQRADAALLVRQRALGQSGPVQRFAEELARAVEDGELPDYLVTLSRQLCTCGREIAEPKTKAPGIALGCACGEVWHRRVGEPRLVLGHPPGREDE